ncbi:MAG: uL15 family ribosomal protein [Candidatus Jacksonbacteria bacterium]|nr:uL15 family ribosomal protein [Candidatus Jacksonbacteria bacterium]
MKLKFHNLQPVPKTRQKKRVGRGNSSGKGTYSTRGIKGQKARAGAGGMRKRSLMRQLVKKIPKLGGFKPARSNHSAITVNVIEKRFAEGETVNRASLVAKKILSAREARGTIKIIGAEPITKHIIIEEDIRLSKQARKILKREE